MKTVFQVGGNDQLCQFLLMRSTKVHLRSDHRDQQSGGHGHTGWQGPWECGGKA